MWWELFEFILRSLKSFTSEKLHLLSFSLIRSDRDLVCVTEFEWWPLTSVCFMLEKLFISHCNISSPCFSVSDVGVWRICVIESKKIHPERWASRVSPAHTPTSFAVHPVARGMWMVARVLWEVSHIRSCRNLKTQCYQCRTAAFRYRSARDRRAAWLCSSAFLIIDWS